jgi:hypothetical protein
MQKCRNNKQNHLSICLVFLRPSSFTHRLAAIAFFMALTTCASRVFCARGVESATSSASRSVTGRRTCRAPLHVATARTFSLSIARLVAKETNLAIFVTHWTVIGLISGEGATEVARGTSAGARTCCAFV